MAYETILGFEERNRMVIVDISAFDDPDEMSRGINLVLDEEEVDRVVLMGQSLSGILAQLYFRRHANRVEALVLTNTLAPKRERCRKWPQLLFACLPFSLLRVLLRRKMRRLGRFDQEIPPLGVCPRNRLNQRDRGWDMGQSASHPRGGSRNRNSRGRRPHVLPAGDG